MAAFYAYRTDSDDSSAGKYKELQLHQFGSKSARDSWCDQHKTAKAVKVAEIPARHMSLFRQFGGSTRPDGGFWGVVDSGTN